MPLCAGALKAEKNQLEKDLAAEKDAHQKTQSSLNVAKQKADAAAKELEKEKQNSANAAKLTKQKQTELENDAQAARTELEKARKAFEEGKAINEKLKATIAIEARKARTKALWFTKMQEVEQKRVATAEAGGMAGGATKPIMLTRGQKVEWESRYDDEKWLHCTDVEIQGNLAGMMVDMNPKSKTFGLIVKVDEKSWASANKIAAGHTYVVAVNGVQVSAVYVSAMTASVNASNAVTAGGPSSPGHAGSPKNVVKAIHPGEGLGDLNIQSALECCGSVFVSLRTDKAQYEKMSGEKTPADDASSKAPGTSKVSVEDLDLQLNEVSQNISDSQRMRDLEKKEEEERRNELEKADRELLYKMNFLEQSEKAVRDAAHYFDFQPPSPDKTHEAELQKLRETQAYEFYTQPHHDSHHRGTLMSAFISNVASVFDKAYDGITPAGKSSDVGMTPPPPGSPPSGAGAVMSAVKSIFSSIEPSSPRGLGSPTSKYYHPESYQSPMVEHHDYNAEEDHNYKGQWGGHIWDFSKGEGFTEGLIAREATPGHNGQARTMFNNAPSTVYTPGLGDTTPRSLGLRAPDSLLRPYVTGNTVYAQTPRGQSEPPAKLIAPLGLTGLVPNAVERMNEVARDITRRAAERELEASMDSGVVLDQSSATDPQDITAASYSANDRSGISKSPQKAAEPLTKAESMRNGDGKVLNLPPMKLSPVKPVGLG